MNPRIGRIQARCASLLMEVAESGMAAAPSPETREEAVLGCAVLALMAESAGRPDGAGADQIAAVLSAVVNLAKSQGVTPAGLREQIEDRLEALYAIPAHAN